MKKRLFLTGPSGCGKSTILRNALGAKAAQAGGFVTDRILDDTGRYLYFCLQRADGTGERAVFLDLRHNPPKKDDRAFTEIAAPILRETPRFALLDEIGGMELLLPEFRTALEGFLSAGIPCIGVLKGVKNSGALAKTAGLPVDYLTAAQALRRRLEEDENTLVLEVSGWDDRRAMTAAAQWVEEYAHA